LKCWRHAKPYPNDGSAQPRMIFLIAMVPFAGPILPMWCTKASDLSDGQKILTVICQPGPILVHRPNQPGIDWQSELKDCAAW
jgi:hypothetical protein